MIVDIIVEAISTTMSVKYLITSKSNLIQALSTSSKRMLLYRYTQLCKYKCTHKYSYTLTAGSKSVCTRNSLKC